MESLFWYLLKSSLCISIFWMVYRLFLKKETFYQLSRYFLLFGFLASLFLPFIQLSYEVSLPSSIANAGDQYLSPTTAAWDTPVLWTIGLALYFSGLLFFLTRQLLGFLKVRSLIKSHNYNLVDGCSVAKTDRFETSFSIYKYIFIALSINSSPKEQQLILDHELAHAKGNHWLDLLIAQLFCCLQWFNPLAWYYTRDIKENHEFLADEQVLQKGHSGAEYRAALINQSLKVPVFQFSSAFANQDQIKRVHMMLKKQSSPIRMLTALLTIPLLMLLLTAFAKPVYLVKVADKKEKPSTVTLRKDVHLPAVPKVIAIKRTQKKKVKGLTHITSKRTVETIQVQEENTVKPNPSLHIKLASDPFNAPIYIVDGLEVSSLDDLVPDQIQSVNILKASHGTALYGPKAINGVIIVTTKVAPPPIK